MGLIKYIQKSVCKGCEYKFRCLVSGYTACGAYSEIASIGFIGIGITAVLFSGFPIFINIALVVFYITFAVGGWHSFKETKKAHLILCEVDVYMKNMGWSLSSSNSSSAAGSSSSAASSSIMTTTISRSITNRPGSKVRLLPRRPPIRKGL